jgi:hypothetical protein
MLVIRGCRRMSKIKTTKVDLTSLEPTHFNLVLSTSFSPEEIQKLNELGGELKYDGGLTALITIPAVRIEEFAQIESVLEVH